VSIILPKCEFVIAESQAVINQYMRDFNITFDSIVIPNAPAYRSNHTGKVILNNSRIKLIHHGNIVKERRLEFIIDAICKLENKFELTLMGAGSVTYIKFLKKKYKKNSNIIFSKAVAYDELIETLTVYDAGLIIFGSKHFHHQFMTVPNKFWECLQARVPVIVSKTSAMNEIVQDNNCGISVDASDLNELIHSLSLINSNHLNMLVNNCEIHSFINSRDAWQGRLLGKINKLQGDV
jgi:glycosyltransferase involved in cell wall biosynthesis